MRVWPLLFAIACQGPSTDGPTKPTTDEPTETTNPDDTEVGLGHAGDLTYLHLAPNLDREVSHLMLGFFAEDLQGLPFASACVVTGTLCVDAIPLAEDSAIDVVTLAFDPDANRIVWVGDEILIGDVPVDFIADAGAGLGWYRREIPDFPALMQLDLTLGGEWGNQQVESFVPTAAPMEMLSPPVDDFLPLSTLQTLEITWTPGFGDVYLDVFGPSGFHQIHRLEDDGQYDLDISPLGSFNLGDITTFDLIRILSESTMVAGNTLTGHGISMQRFSGGLALPRTCLDHLNNDPSLSSGIYEIQPDLNPPIDVYCDMVTDGGGWTLVGASVDEPLDDKAGGWHTDLTTLFPTSRNLWIWDGLRNVILTTSDIRFTCKAEPGLADMDVDLSFYDTKWYREFTTGSDADSCFSEFNGSGYDQPAAERTDNLTGVTRVLGQDWETQGYLEGEDTCEDLDDFTIDFNDRGMDGNESDGTDWGEDDGSFKCGVEGLQTGAWFVFVREI